MMALNVSYHPCLWSLRIYSSSLPGSRLTNFYRSGLLQLANQWLNFTYSRSHSFRYYGRKNTDSGLTRIELTTSALLAGVQVTYYNTTRAARAMLLLMVRKRDGCKVKKCPTFSCRLIFSRLIPFVVIGHPPRSFLFVGPSLLRG